MDYQGCQSMKQEILKRVLSNAKEWKKFLSCAAKFYKYSFPNQLLIYGQNPAAKACASSDEWNRVARKVQKNVKPITLYNTNAKHGTEQTYCAYDVSQTEAVQNDRFRLWKVNRAEIAQLADKLRKEHPALSIGRRRSTVAKHYVPGQAQPSFDKQFLRDWLVSTGWNKCAPPPTLPQEVIDQTRQKYVEAYELLTGEVLSLP